MKKIVGYRNIKTKKGVDLTLVTVLTEFTDREKSFGAVGHKAEDIFLPDELFDSMKPEYIGKEFVPNYNVSNGRAYLIDYTIK